MEFLEIISLSELTENEKTILPEQGIVKICLIKF